MKATGIQISTHEACRRVAKNVIVNQSMNFRLAFKILIFIHFAIGAMNAQQPLLQFEEEFFLKSAWQEYMPDVYAINDSIIVSAGLNTNMNTLSMNLFVRWMHIDGSTLQEVEVLNIDNPDGYSYNLPTYRIESAIDENFIYLITVSESDSCESTNPMKRTYHFSKVSLSLGSIERDTFICFEDIRVYQDISAYPGNDTLFLYGSMGYLNEDPAIILTTLSKDFNEIVTHVIQTEDTHLLPIENQEDPRAVTGSHNPYDSDYENQDVWFGRLEGDSILQEHRMKYFYRDYVRKAVRLDEREMAFITYDVLFAVSESSIYVFRDDTLRWNFFNAFFVELEDIQKIGEHYCILESDFRNFGDQNNTVILHYIDKEGFPFDSSEHLTPWIRFALTGLVIDSNYFAFVYISDQDILQLVVDGQIPKEEAHYEFTQVFKFRINE